jgi:hypothetical protein
MMDVRELARRWAAGHSNRKIAPETGTDRSTTARYIAAAQELEVLRDRAHDLTDGERTRSRNSSRLGLVRNAAMSGRRSPRTRSDRTVARGQETACGSRSTTRGGSSAMTKTIVPDSTRAIVKNPDALDPTLTSALAKGRDPVVRAHRPAPRREWLPYPPSNRRDRRCAEPSIEPARGSGRVDAEALQPGKDDALQGVDEDRAALLLPERAATGERWSRG